MSNLEYLIRNFIKNSNCVVMREAKYDWEGFDEKFEPDISLLCGLRKRKRLCYTDVPRFVAEILSDSTEQIDRNKKMEVYSAVGVEEYWLVDWRVPGGKVERYLLDDNGERYLLHDIITGKEEDAEVSIIMFPKIRFKMSELMEHVGEDIL
jgi:Uma2 family endonuclease